jgi:hypothetical protein
VNKKRVERIWRCEGLKVPAKQPKRGRLWLNDGSCLRLRPERPNHVWSYGSRPLLRYGVAIVFVCVREGHCRNPDWCWPPASIVL